MGIISISRMPWVSPSSMVECAGILLLFVCTVSSAVGNVLVAREKSDMDPIFLNSVQIFLGGLGLFLVSLVVEGTPHLVLPINYYLALAWLSFLSAVSFTLWFVLLQRPGITVSGLNLWKFIIPVFGALFSWTFLADESPTLIPILGMICIALAIIVYNAAEIREGKKKPVTPPV
jgi:drug/metabolite transporter (DMT)-like permease